MLYLLLDLGYGFVSSFNLAATKDRKYLFVQTRHNLGGAEDV